jgi:hypothetical protein
MIERIRWPISSRKRMAQTCSVCKHADRAAIEAAHVEGRSLRVIASQFAGTSPWSLVRHFKHIPAIIAKVTEHEVQHNAATGKTFPRELRN